jgi:hypothetical protein
MKKMEKDAKKAVSQRPSARAPATARLSLELTGNLRAFQYR